MAITRLGGANAITGTLPAANINDTSIGNITALPAGVGGKVLQVVQGETTTQVSHTASYADTGLSASITPSSTSNKILIQVSQHYRIERYGGAIRILRDSTSIFEALNNQNYQLYGDPGTNSEVRSYACLTYLDSPSSTSSITYKTQGSRHNSGGAFRTQDDSLYKSTITLIEVVA